jgi:hypothetical protein
MCPDEDVDAVDLVEGKAIDEPAEMACADLLRPRPVEALSFSAAER